LRYDLALFEQLNEDYRDRPLVRVAPASTAAGAGTAAAGAAWVAERQRHAAAMQLTPILRDIDLAGKVVLEIGCRQGWLVSILPERAGAATAIGVDVNRYPEWDEFGDPRLRMVEADLAKDPVVPAGSVDTIISNAVLGRDLGPLTLLSTARALLKDGGELWLRAKGTTAPTASARYRDVFFPWPHLLFEDDVCEQFYLKHHGKAGQRFPWLSRLTAAHYAQAARELGFEVTLARRKVVPIDVPFYLRFLDKLGRYAALDLETDLLTLVLSKTGQASTNPASASIDVAYAARQHALDQAILRLVEEGGFAPAELPPARPALDASVETERPISVRPSSATPPTVPATALPSAASADSRAGVPENINTPGYWDRVYRREWESGDVFSATYARDYGPVHDRIIALIPEDARVLDVACGAGVLCRKVKGRLPGTSVVGVDFSQYTIDRNRRQDRGSGAEYRCLDVQTALGTLGRRFDVVVMAEIIEHLDDPVRTISDGVGLLRPGGRLIITCPHDDAIPSKQHVQQWGHDELFHLLARYGETVCFAALPPPYDKWMMAHLTTPA
jgi:2-polyprenyl-3-methyl-5-hydroxy-6-metoxy-1,4-benzoquinol methylase